VLYFGLEIHFSDHESHPVCFDDDDDDDDDAVLT